MYKIYLWYIHTHTNSGDSLKVSNTYFENDRLENVYVVSILMYKHK